MGVVFDIMFRCKFESFLILSREQNEVQTHSQLKMKIETLPIKFVVIHTAAPPSSSRLRSS